MSEASSTEQLTAEENSLLIEGFGDSDSESYTVQSVRLRLRPRLQTLYMLSSSGIQGIEADAIDIEAFPGGFRFLTSDVFTGCVYDISGKLIASPRKQTDIQKSCCHPGYI